MNGSYTVKINCVYHTYGVLYDTVGVLFIQIKVCSAVSNNTPCFYSVVSKI